jgi:hypothetical protein
MMRMAKGFRRLARLSQEAARDDDVFCGHGPDTLRLALADRDAVTLEQSGFRTGDALDAA